MGLTALMEVAQGTINGTNVVFTLSTSYVPGSVQVFLNGQALLKDSPDGWVEEGANRFRLLQAPLSLDTVSAYYRPL